MMRRWLTRVVVLAVTALGLPVLAGVGPAAASPGWIDGGFANSSIINCGSIIWGSPYSEFGLMTYTGYYGDLGSAVPSPKAGDTFYVHVVVGAPGNSCSGQLAWVDIQLPTGVTAAGAPVCYYDGVSSTDTACRAMASPYNSGALSIVRSLGSNFNTEVWAAPTGHTLDYVLPVTASGPVSGTLRSYIRALDGNSNPWLTPTSGMYVAPNGTSGPPSIGYLSPSTTITPGATPGYNSVAMLTTGVAGTGRFIIGTSAGSNSLGTADDVVGAIGVGEWVINNNWENSSNQVKAFVPRATYHWKLCFTPSGGSEQCGADQTFVAVGADSVRPTVSSVTYLGANAGTALDPVTSKAVSFKMTFSEPVQGVGNCLTESTGGLSAGIIQLSPSTGLSTSYLVTVPNVGLGSGVIGVGVMSCPSVTDAAGNTLSNSASNSVIVNRTVDDTTAPAIATLALPAVSLSTATQKWNASDAVGLGSFRVKSRTTSQGGVVGAWTAGTSYSRTLRQAPLATVRGATRCDSVTAYDTSGNSTTAATRCTITPFDERSVSSTGTWTKPANSSAYYASTISKSSQVGATKFLTGAKGNRVVVVAQKRPGAGTIQVLVNGVVKSTISLAATSIKNKQVFTVVVPSFTNAKVSVRVKTAGTTGVWIDGFGVGTL